MSNNDYDATVSESCDEHEDDLLSAYVSDIESSSDWDISDDGKSDFNGSDSDLRLLFFQNR